MFVKTTQGYVDADALAERLGRLEGYTGLHGDTSRMNAAEGLAYGAGRGELAFLGLAYAIDEDEDGGY